MDDSDAKRHLAAAMDAAVAHTPGTYLLELVESAVLERLTRVMAAEWPNAGAGLIDTVVSEAADAMYTAIANRDRQVKDPAAYLWGAARNILRTQHDAGLVGLQEYKPEIHNQINDSDGETLDRGLLRDEALRHARALLPRLRPPSVLIEVATRVTWPG
jgi:hypothetical protein